MFPAQTLPRIPTTPHTRGSAFLVCHADTPIRRPADTFPSPSRMKPFVNRLQVTLIHMRVNLRRRNIRVPQKLLNDSQIRAIREKVRCERVPEEVRIDVGVKS